MLSGTRLLLLLTVLSLSAAACTAGFSSTRSQSGGSEPEESEFGVDDDDSGPDDDDDSGPDDDDTDVNDDDIGDDDVGDDDVGDDDDTGTAPEGTYSGDCSDGVDNDADLLIDCADPSCWSSPDCSGDDDDASPADDDDATSDDDDDATSDDDDGGLFEGDEPGECSDGADNDQDGLFDCDDPNCAGAPDCSGDDDDSSPSGSAPSILNVSASWDTSASQFVFILDLQDPDCNMNPVTLYWSLSGQPENQQPPISQAGIECGTQLTFTLDLLNAVSGQTYPFTFRITDSAGNSSSDYSVTVQVP